jgi:hypothetical protein
MTLSKRWFYIFSSIIAAILILPLLAHAYIGFFSRYWWDDFCTSGFLHQKGFWGSQLYWYTSWSGRFSFHIIVNIAEMIGTWTVEYLPSLALLTWGTVTTWTICQIFKINSLRFPLISSFLLTLLIIFSTLNSTPDIVQSLYWQAGMLSYLAPLIMLTGWIGVLVYALRKRSTGRSHKLLILIVFVLTFISAGLSEAYAFLQLGVLGILTLIYWVYFSRDLKRIALPLILAGFLGGGIAFLIVFTAPGNKGRQATLPPPSSPVLAVKSSLSYTLNFAERHSRRSRAVTLLCLIFPAWLALMLYYTDTDKIDTDEHTDKNNPSHESDLNIKTALKIVGLCIACGFFLIFTCFVPAFYALSEALPLRAQILSKFVLVSFMVFAGWIFARALINTFAGNRKFKSIGLVAASAAVVILLVISPIIAAKNTFALGNKAKDYAVKWDAINRQLAEAKNSGESDAVIPKVTADEFDLGYGRPDLQPADKPHDGPNYCIEIYYGLDSVRTE